MINELLVPRRAIKFAPHESGRFISLADDIPEVLQQPWVRARIGTLRGYESGYRSGLVKVADRLFKLKGCRPGKGTHGYEPLGSQTYSLARYEADQVSERREAIIRNGFEYSLEPKGFYAYDDILFKEEPTTATLYEIKGDTRSDEFLDWLERMPLEHTSLDYVRHIQNVLATLGFRTGKMLRLMHKDGVTWDSDPQSLTRNAHNGNIVIFPGINSSANTGLVDFDNMYDHRTAGPEETKEVGAARLSDISHLYSTAADDWLISGSRGRRSVYPFASGLLVDTEIEKVIPDMDSWHRGQVGGKILRVLNPLQYIRKPREYFSGAIVQGYFDMSDDFGALEWEVVRGLANDVTSLIRQFIARIQEELGGQITRETVVEYATKYNLW